MAAEAALPYQEPGILTILIQASFLLALNLVNSVLDHVVYCGLVGQVLIGMAWGTPGAKILSRPFEQVATQLGYLGLIVIVFEGGLATSAKSVQATLLLSICVALTGVVLPIAFSFSLRALADASNLQSFAAGSALCSTSLGTTFSILKTTGLTGSRLGTVLTSAAMLDDVVGLIMVQVISNLGSGRGSVQATTVIRPVFVSIGFALVLPLACRFLIRPILIRSSHLQTTMAVVTRGNGLISAPAVYFLLATALLVGMVCAASYAGTSGLFAAYLAGACIAWLDDSIAQVASTRAEKPIGNESSPVQEEDDSGHQPEQSSRSAKSPEGSDDSAVHKISTRDTHKDQITRTCSSHPPTARPANDTVGDADKSTPVVTSSRPELESRGLSMYNTYYGPVAERILKPLFFASIGFSIPISKMFRGPIVWRGFVYAALMAVGKLFCGLWLVRLTRVSKTAAPAPAVAAVTASTTAMTDNEPEKKQSSMSRQPVARPKSLYPASLLGSAMVARGEIGFLISALAASNGIFDSDSHIDNKTSSSTGADLDSSEIYLIVTWAILLCTIAGPLALGFLARRVKRLQRERAKSDTAGGEDPLGIWGVS